MTKSKALLQINSVVNTGSTGMIVEDIGLVMKSQGWDNQILYGRNSNSSQLNSLKVGAKTEQAFHVLRTRLFDRHGFGSKRATKELVRVIKSLNPSVIHLHNIHGYYLNIEILFNVLSSSNIPVVWTLHDCWAFTGHCVHFDLVGCNKWQTTCEKCPQKKDYPASWLFDASKRNFLDKKALFTSVERLELVCVSDWLFTKVGQSFLGDLPRQVIHNGIDLDIFKRKKASDLLTKYGLENKRVLLAVANVWDERKNLVDYIKLSKRLDSNSQLILIGLSRKQIQSLPENVVGMERTNNQTELVKLYSIADVVLNLSLEESFGLTTVEGFACGTPSVVYNCTASPELISPDTGKVVEKGDIDGIMSSIEDLLKRDRQLSAIACRQRAEEKYEKKKAYEKYSHLYQRVTEL